MRADQHIHSLPARLALLRTALRQGSIPLIVDSGFRREREYGSEYL
jgi:hypothetical protein